MSALISYFVLGLTLALPFGPVNATQIEQGLRKGVLHSWLIGLGSVLADGVFMLLVYFGVVHFLQIPFMKTFLWLFGFIVLTWTGSSHLAHAGSPQPSGNRATGSYFKAFSTGFLMSITNPLAILFWLGIFGSVLADMIARYDAKHVLVYSTAVLIPILIWDSFMAFLAGAFRHLLTKRLLTAISVISGLFLIGFGLYFAAKAFHALFG